MPVLLITSPTASALSPALSPIPIASHHCSSCFYPAFSLALLADEGSFWDRFACLFEMLEGQGEGQEDNQGGGRGDRG